MSNILLGPILGIESDDSFTVIIFTKQEFKNLQLQLFVSNDRSRINPEIVRQLQTGYYYKFRIFLDVPPSDIIVSYSLYNVSNQRLSNQYGKDFWTFEVPGRDTHIRVFKCSCNGISHIRASDLEEENFKMWRKMEAVHRDFKGHCLIMSGDQVYADSLWEEVEYLNNISYILEDKAKVAGFQLGTTRGKLEQELRIFYEKLYIDNWSNKSMSNIMASIPSAMMWDDHDIFDGYGSHEPELQESELFKSIFKIASEYFLLFQIRGNTNQSLINLGNNHYSLHFCYRNYEFVIMDHRSFRTRNRIMNAIQYNDIELSLSVKTITNGNQENRILSFVSPVPISHFYYTEFLRNVAALKGVNDFRKAAMDDTIDQWSHPNHRDEQEKILSLIFRMGARKGYRYVCILSGDVHSAGAARVESENTFIVENTMYYNCVSQLIASSIIHPPSDSFLVTMLRWFTRSKSKIPFHKLFLKNFGATKQKTIHRRNFMVIAKKEGTALKTYLYLDLQNEKGSDTEYSYTLPLFTQKLEILRNSTS